MKTNVPEEIERYRITTGRYATGPDIGMYGAFYIPHRSHTLCVMISAGKIEFVGEDIGGWEHVSVSLSNRCPNWREMSYVKSLFWDDHETVIQFHPKKTEYINCHPHCLHLWKKTGIDHELPPSLLVGPKE